LAIVAQVYRGRKGWQQHVTQAELEAERLRNEVLVSELDQLTREDPLTSVGNRRAWEERLTGEFLRARRSGRPLSVIVCDFDHFKEVNDLHGHSVGDAVLRSGAAVLAERVRPADFVARLGGDEFAILCPETPLDGAVRLASDVGERIRSAIWPAGIDMTCSIGVAELDHGDRTTEDLYHRADCALYEAKRARDTLRCAEPSAGRW
jgi:diguanylate cyclase (GGDEF)-like protein